MSETAIQDIDDTTPGPVLPDITDAQIKTALCYVDAKATCQEDKDLNFPDVFAESWAEMLSNEAEDAESDDPDIITVAQMCQWYRQGLVHQHPALLPQHDGPTVIDEETKDQRNARREAIRNAQDVSPLGDLL